MTGRPQLRGYLLISGATLFWAVSGTLAKSLFKSRPIEPVMLVEFRMIFACLLMGLLLAVSNPPELRIRRADLPFLAVYGSLGMAMVQVTYFVAVSEGTVSTAIFLQYLAPLVTAGYETAAGRKLPSKALLTSLALATCGSATLLLSGSGGLSTSRLGLVAGLASAGFMSFYTVYGARAVARYSPRTVLLWITGIAALALAPVARPWQAAGLGLTVTDWVLLLYLGTFGTLVPFAMFLAGLKYVRPVPATLTAMLEPVLATVIAWIFLAETLSALQLAGAGLIIGAVANLQLRRPRGRQAGSGSSLPGEPYQVSDCDEQADGGVQLDGPRADGHNPRRVTTGRPGKR